MGLNRLDLSSLWRNQRLVKEKNEMHKLKVCGNRKHAVIHEAIEEPGEYYIFCLKHLWYIYNLLRKPCEEFRWKPNA